MTRTNALYAMVAFALGATVALAAKPTVTFDPNDYYVGKEPKAASTALLAQAEKPAGKDTWDRIGIGRVAYLSGDKAKGEALFQSVLDGPKVGKGDIYRIATAYAVAKDWAKAKPLFERAMAMDTDDVWHYIFAGASYAGVAPF